MIDFFSRNLSVLICIQHLHDGTATEKSRAERAVLPGLGNHPLCGPATLSVGTIRGGASVNTVPDRATIEIDRRLMPGEDPAEACGHAAEYLAAALSPTAAIQHDLP